MPCLRYNIQIESRSQHFCSQSLTSRVLATWKVAAVEQGEHQKKGTASSDRSAEVKSNLEIFFQLLILKINGAAARKKDRASYLRIDNLKIKIQISG